MKSVFVAVDAAGSRETVSAEKAVLEPMLCRDGAVMHASEREAVTSAIVDGIAPLCMTVDVQNVYWTSHDGRVWRGGGIR